MRGATPPCSRAARTPGASFERSIQPTRADPMKLKKPMRSLVTARSATSLSQGAMTHQSSGRPASR